MSERSDWWRAIAITALTKFTAGDTGDGHTFEYSMAAGASGYLYGWSDPGTQALLVKLIATRNPDRGYGVGEAWDAYQNGTINPADTSYSVTMAGHAGPTLLAAYIAGAPGVVRQDVQDLVNLCVGLPRVTVPRGAAVCYSRNANDISGGNVHNVNAGVGWFLSDCNAAGFSRSGMQSLITNIAICEMVSFREASHWWPYANAGANADTDHNSYQVESGYRLMYWPARDSAYLQMTTAGTESTAPIAHTRLAGLPGGIGSQALTPQAPGQTLWGELSDQWRTEQTAYLAAQGVGSDRAAQFAYYAARASLMVG